MIDMSSDRKCRLQASLPLSYPPSLAVPSSYIHCLALSPGPLSPVAFTTWTVAPQAGVEQTIKGLIFLIKLGSQRHPVFCRDLLKGGGEGAGFLCPALKFTRGSNCRRRCIVGTFRHPRDTGGQVILVTGLIPA